MSNDPNTFSQQSGEYAAWRPSYPPALFEWISGMCGNHDSAWDCAAGNGQAAIGLGAYFKHVEATDVSQEQVANAIPHPNVHYAQAPAEASGFRDEAFDLVTVAQALHWFDFGPFWQEVRRVSRPGAFFCAWGYSWFEGEPGLEKEVLVPYREALGPFWAKNNQILWDGYPSNAIEFPFKRLTTPEFAIQVRWTLQQVVSYMHTWSAYKRCDASTKQLLDAQVQRYSSIGTADRTFDLRMPLTVVAGYVDHN